MSCSTGSAAKNPHLGGATSTQSAKQIRILCRELGLDDTAVSDGPRMREMQRMEIAANAATAQTQQKDTPLPACLSGSAFFVEFDLFGDLAVAGVETDKYGRPDHEEARKAWRQFGAEFLSTFRDARTYPGRWNSSSLAECPCDKDKTGGAVLLCR